jgi:hypothetical protein
MHCYAISMQMPAEEAFIQNLEEALKEVQEKYVYANAQRTAWQNTEATWQREVNMIAGLLNVRKARLDEARTAFVEEQNKLAAQADVSTDSAEPTEDAEEPEGDVEVADGVNRVEWAYEQVAKSGNGGMSAPELFTASQIAKLSMHKNYPYVALGKLVERSRIEKRGTRYYPKTAAQQEVDA